MSALHEEGSDRISIPVRARVLFHGVEGVVVGKTDAPVTTHHGRNYEVTARYFGSLVMFPGSCVGQWLSDADLSVLP